MIWTSLDTWMVLTACLAGMSCALPGLWLVLRRNSMMGDALAHSALLGVVGTFLAVSGLRAVGLIGQDSFDSSFELALVGGAVVVGLLTAFLTEWLQTVGRLAPGAALGVVFSSLFALGLLLIRLVVDDVHLDTDCVLFGNLVSSVSDRLPGTRVPRAAALNAGVLVMNLCLTALFFKELRLASFDPDFASSQGLPSRRVHYALMTATSMTVVAAFETVGSILVIGLLVVPAATAILLTRSLKAAVLLSLVVACVSGLLGHVAAITVPPRLFAGWGIQDADTAGSMSVVGGVLFVIAWLFSPRGGLVNRWWRQLGTTVDVAAEDLLGALWRLEERGIATDRRHVLEVVGRRFGVGRWVMRLALNRLRGDGLVSTANDGSGHHGQSIWTLTTPGREAAQGLVRVHRLWETYLSRHFQLPEDHLHGAAHRAEHFIDARLERKLAEELGDADVDPHGSSIPDAPPKP